MIGLHDRGNELKVNSQGEGLTILHTPNRRWTQQAIWTALVRHHQVLVKACNLATRWELKVTKKQLRLKVFPCLAQYQGTLQAIKSATP